MVPYLESAGTISILCIQEDSDCQWQRGMIGNERDLSWNGGGLGPSGLLLEALLELLDPLQELGELARVEGWRCRRLRGGAVQ